MASPEEKPASPLGVLDHLMEGCQIIDPTWRYVYVNEAAARQGRRPVAALVGERIQDLFPGVEHTPLFATLARCMETRAHDRLVSEFVYPDGSSAWYELRLEPVPEGLFIMSLDLTAQRAVESALRDRDAQLRVFSETIPDPIFMKDLDGRWTFANPAALRVVGRSAAEALGKTERELYADPAVADALMETDRRIMERGVAEVLEEVVQTPDGYRTYLTTKVPYRDEAGRVVGLMGNARDITDRKVAASRVARRAAVAALPDRLRHQRGDAPRRRRARPVSARVRHHPAPRRLRGRVDRHRRLRAR